MDYKLTIAALISAIIIAVALYQAYSSSLLNTPYTNTIPSDNLNTKACAKPFNKNYMGWAPTNELPLNIQEDFAPEIEKNPLLFLKGYGSTIVLARVISLGEKAYLYDSLSAEYYLPYKILILDIIYNSSSFSPKVGELIDGYYVVFNVEVLKQKLIQNTTPPNVIEKINPRLFTDTVMPLDVGNEYILYLSFDLFVPSKLFIGRYYFVFDSKVYSPDNVSYPVYSKPLTRGFYSVCGMPLSDFINLIKYVNSK
jgi:hypothetical protein